MRWAIFASDVAVGVAVGCATGAAVRKCFGRPKAIDLKEEEGVEAPLPCSPAASGPLTPASSVENLDCIESAFPQEPAEQPQVVPAAQEQEKPGVPVEAAETQKLESGTTQDPSERSQEPRKPVLPGCARLSRLTPLPRVLSAAHDPQEHEQEQAGGVPPQPLSARRYSLYTCTSEAAEMGGAKVVPDSLASSSSAISVVTAASDPVAAEQEPPSPGAVDPPAAEEQSPPVPAMHFARANTWAEPRKAFSAVHEPPRQFAWPMQRSFPKGCTVEVSGLLNLRQHNGKKALVSGHRRKLMQHDKIGAPTGPWLVIVDLGNGSPTALRPGNCKRIEAVWKAAHCSPARTRSFVRQASRAKSQDRGAAW